jgi:hypothetical protein
MVSTPGHITRLKLIKRSMYGRAQFDLLRLRVLSPPKKRKNMQGTKAGVDHKPRKGRVKSQLQAETGFHSQLTTSLINARCVRVAESWDLQRTRSYVPGSSRPGSEKPSIVETFA